MTARPRLESTHLVLVPQTLAAARALLAGEDPGLPLAEGYPHADTFDALRMVVEHGGPDDGDASVPERSALAQLGSAIGPP